MQKFKITFSLKGKETKVWDPAVDVSLDGLRSLMMLGRKFSPNKDGNVMIPGELVGTKRTKAAVKSVSVLMYDVDSGQPVEEVREKLKEAGVVAFIYSSFSHLTTKSLVHTGQYHDWAKKAGEPLAPTAASMRAFLEETKYARFMDKNPVFDDSLENVDKAIIQTEEGGAFYVVTHDPIEKYRIVIPLKEPIVLLQLSPVMKLANPAYVSIYHGIGQTLGIEYDHACSDISRLYYLPRSPEGVPYFSEEINAENLETANLLDWKAYPRVKLEKGKDKTQRPKSDFIVPDRNGKPINVMVWDRANYDFDIEAILTQALPDEMIRSQRVKGGFHIECPFEHNHTNPGGEGTFCANGDGDNSWTIHCTHNSCKSAGHTKLDFLSEFIKQGHLTADDLGIEDTPVPPDIEQMAKAMNVDLSTLPHNLGRVAEESVDDPIDTVIPPGDESLSEDDLINECLLTISSATTVMEVRKGVSRLSVRDLDMPWAAIYEAMGRSQVSGRSLQRLIQSWSRGAFAIDGPAAIGEIRKVREEEKSINDCIQELYEEGFKGRDLYDRLDDRAGHYLMDNGIVRQMYHTFENDLVKQEYGPIIHREVSQLSQRYAKLLVGNGLTYLDMVESREKMRPMTSGPEALSTKLRNRNIVLPLVNAKGGPKVERIYVYDRWTQDSSDIKEYDEVVFEPGKPDEFDGKFNLWMDSFGYKGFPVFPKKGDCSPILDHILHDWCAGDEDVFWWVILWLAGIFQRPWHKPATALALLGQQGTGKSIVFQNLIGVMLGRYFGSSGAMDDLVGRFSGHLFGKLLWLSEETLFAGDKKGMNRLKDRISSNTLDMERKYMDKVLVKAFTRYVFTSNQPHALHLEADDRRFCVLQVATTHHQDAEYFGKLAEWMENGGTEYFMEYLMSFKPEDHKLSWYDMEKAPNTAAKMAQAAMSTDIPEDFFLDLLRYGRLMSVPSSALTGPKISWPLRAEEGKAHAFMMKPESFKQAYDDYLRHRASNSAKYDSNKFQLYFSRYFGSNTRPFRDFCKTARVGDGTYTKMVCLGGREEYLNLAVKMKLMSAADRQEALDSPDSHLYSDNSDVL